MRFLIFVLAATALLQPSRAADAVSIAGAANLVYALDALNAEFRKSSPATAVTVTTGASGNLVAQIKNGAPFDVFLSADLDYPRALAASGHAQAKSLVTFAVGRLVLWTMKADLEVDDVATTVRSPSVRKLAIANADSAPYGRAAKQAMEQLGAWTEAQPKLVIGENISQTTQFVSTGNADAGFVALSVVLSPALKNMGRWSEVPSTLYTPLEQGAVLTTRGATNPAAQRYLEFLRSEAAKKILHDYGYGIPP
jgi:molybdate transport system substrate-binding protein